MKSLSEYIMEVSSDLVLRAAHKANHLSITGPRREQEYRAKQADRLYKAYGKKLDEEKKAKLLVPGYVPQDKNELKFIITKRIEKNPKADLNDIDISKIKDMSYLFYDSDFDGDISDWDVSNVKDMEAMFYYSKFTGNNGNISDWNVSNVEDMSSMFAYSEFNGDLSKWDVSNVTNMYSMFASCHEFNSDLSNWNVSNVKNMDFMFHYCDKLKNPPAWYHE